LGKERMRSMMKRTLGKSIANYLYAILQTGDRPK
jgi:hypothetical protein